MKTVFKVGDKVFDARYGCGEVTHLSYTTQYPIEVTFDKCKDHYTYEGYDHLNTSVPLLSFTEYKLEGFSQERPEVLPERGQIVWVRDSELGEWLITQFISKEGDRYKTTDSNPFGDKHELCWNKLTTINPYKQ